MSSGYYIEWRITKKATKQEAFVGVKVKVEAGAEMAEAPGVAPEGAVESEAVPVLLVLLVVLMLMLLSPQSDEEEACFMIKGGLVPRYQIGSVGRTRPL